MVHILQTSGSIDMILVAIDSLIPNYIVNVILFLRSGEYYKKYTRVKLGATWFSRVLEYIYTLEVRTENVLGARLSRVS